MNEAPPPKDDRDFFLVVKASSAIGMGLMAGFVFSIKQVHPELQIRVDMGVVLVGLAAAVFSWVLCALLAKEGRPEAEGDATAAGARRRRFLVRWLVSFLIVCSLGTVAAFSYALKGASSRSQRDVIEGTVIACLVLAAGGWLIRRAFRFFEEHSEAELEQRREDGEEEGP